MIRPPLPPPPARRRVLAAAVLLGLAGPAHAEEFGLGLGQRDMGGIGLMQTPTARMGEAGHFGAGGNRTSPYRRWSMFLQPTDWMEVGFRYIQVENREYAAADGERYNLDKGADLRLRLAPETRYRPAIAIGLQDAGGTTLFGAEYLVASKRWNNLDFSLGLGWGYLGNQADIDSPLGWIDDRFDERGGRSSGDQGGRFNTSQLFRGPAAVFGGVEYQTPWDRLILQLEYEGNDYRNEPQDNHQEQDSRFNVGARFRLARNVELHAGWQRGNTAMIGLHMTTNLARLSQIKQDPPPVDPARVPRRDWANVADDLHASAGIRVRQIEQVGQRIRITGEPTRFRAMQQAEGRGNRLLQAQTGPEVNTFEYRWQTFGLDLRESLHDREAFGRALRARDHEPAYRHGIRVRDVRPANAQRNGDKTLYQSDRRRFEYAIGPSLEQNFGGPDGYLYRVAADLDADYFLDHRTWISGQLSATVADNLHRYEYIADSELPRVRTHIGDYMAESDIGIHNLQLTHAARLGQNWYAMGYTGLLERMYAGAGGELLWRPFNGRIAVGADVNWVRQRAFDQRFGLRDYNTWTGHLTTYVDTGIEDIHARISAGRYLARDLGTTLDFSREFASGVRAGAWATFTDARDDFGEGGFDKGLYLSIPYDAFFTTSSRDRAEVSWQPLTRDGGARLHRRHTLFDITEERQLGPYWDDPGAPWR